MRLDVSERLHGESAAMASTQDSDGIFINIGKFLEIAVARQNILHLVDPAGAIVDAQQTISRLDQDRRGESTFLGKCAACRLSASASPPMNQNHTCKRTSPRRLPNRAVDIQSIEGGDEHVSDFRAIGHRPEFQIEIARPKSTDSKKGQRDNHEPSTK